MSSQLINSASLESTIDIFQNILKASNQAGHLPYNPWCSVSLFHDLAHPHYYVHVVNIRPSTVSFVVPLSPIPMFSSKSLSASYLGDDLTNDGKIAPFII